jgi:RNA polymerase subunit RPABC4/transcription elongation factor Spt4
MSDTKDPSPSRRTSPHRAEASATAGAATQQAAPQRSSAAADYWQGVAAIGRTAKSSVASQAGTEQPVRHRGLRT